ncbi:MAG: histidine phosphatase family protein [Desulfotignum sp.]|nr:histidine phosphatase family protein [Desulfotignum sp.]MCF8087996.1 histidine phosphatase family protein [Desulfotignum sp.]MCF8137718.1 histidine phosphatase family protein [Desulfotignum sp.]
MNRKYEVKSDQTLTVIKQLLNQGITKIAAIIRHSERLYSTQARMEPFMNLTTDGLQYAVEMGQNLPAGSLPRMYSSYIGRCIETAYLIDKGFSRQHGIQLPHNQPKEQLAPFYIKDNQKALALLKEQGTHAYIRNWFDNRLDDTVMESPATTTAALTRFMTEKVNGLADNEIAICVSHDWNIFPLKEFALGLPHEEAGDIDYLDGVVFFKNKNRMYVTSYQTDPRPVDAASPETSPG